MAGSFFLITLKVYNNDPVNKHHELEHNPLHKLSVQILT